MSVQTARKMSSKKSSSNNFNKAVGIEAPKINGKEFPLKLGFTKSNELFVGRLAMLGFSSALIGEVRSVWWPAACSGD